MQYGGPWAENYWYENSDVVNDPKLNRFTPRDVVERKTLRRPGWWAPSQWSFQLFAEQAAKMVAAGGRVGMGSHGQLQGLGAQWEIWNIASGGMPKYDVLRVATIFGAEAIGHEKDVGSLEAGKFADLQVLDKNPLDDIKNTNTIKYVMKNGRLYDGNTLDEVWPRQKQIARLWWWPATRRAPAGQTLGHGQQVAVGETIIAQHDVADRVCDRRVEDRAVGDERVELPAFAARVDGARQIGEQRASRTRAPRTTRRAASCRRRRGAPRIRGRRTPRRARASAVPRAETIRRSREAQPRFAIASNVVEKEIAVRDRSEARMRRRQRDERVRHGRVVLLVRAPRLEHDLVQRQPGRARLRAKQ